MGCLVAWRGLSCQTATDTSGACHRGAIPTSLA